MKAAVYNDYGPPDVIRIADVEKPVPKDDEVLIEVHAASVNPLDWHFLRGTPYLVRMMTGLRKPKAPGLGVDVSGQVEAIGRNVTAFKPGDEVFGSCRGAFAEYTCTRESMLVRKPETMSFEQAASVPVASYTALQGLRDKGKIAPGQKVLINGAAGGVGTFAVQLAKWLGANVTGVCSTRNVELVRSIGADHVIDYTQADFTQGAQRYDLIFDCIGIHSLMTCRRVLNPQGIHVSVGAPSGRWMIVPLSRGITGPLLSRFMSQSFVTIMAKPSKQDLTTMYELMSTGKVTPVLDRCYRLSEVPEAIRYLEQGHARGKVVVTIKGPNAPRSAA